MKSLEGTGPMDADIEGKGLAKLMRQAANRRRVADAIEQAFGPLFVMMDDTQRAELEAQVAKNLGLEV